MDILPDGLTLEVVIAFVFAILGAGLTVDGLRKWARARTSRGWPHVEGKVLSSKVAVSPHSKGGSIYGPQIVYIYSVAGRAYVGKRVYYGHEAHTSVSQRGAERTVGRYRPEQKTRVYYDRDDPGESVLEPGANEYVYLPIALGLFFFFMGMTFFLFPGAWGGTRGGPPR